MARSESRLGSCRVDVTHLQPFTDALTWHITEVVHQLDSGGLWLQARIDCDEAAVLRLSSMDHDSYEEVLPGGNSSREVVRVGDTVHRPAMPWSSSVDALLLHLQKIGFQGAPRALGYDEAGRQVLSFVEGYVDPDPSDLDDSRLVEVGRMIRSFHDASATFVPPSDATWGVVITPDREDLICHHDLAPWNLVRTSTQLTFIDWDGAGPGSRLWDLAYAAHGFVPLSPDASLSDEVASRRLAALVDGYDLSRRDRARLVDMLGPRVLSMYELLKRGRETDTQPWSKLWDEGHGEVWLAHAFYVQGKRNVWAAALNVSNDFTD